MILNENSIAIILALDNHLDIIRQTLTVWTRVATAYGNGSELFLVDMDSTDGTSEYFEGYLDTISNMGLKVAYTKIDRKNISEAYNKPLKMGLVQCRYVLFSEGDSYPNGYILEEYEPFLQENRILNGVRREIKSPFRYGVIKSESMDHYQKFLDMEKYEKPWEVFIGNNSVFPHELLANIDGWNQEFSYYGADKEIAMIAKLKDKAEFTAVDRAQMFHCTHDEVDSKEVEKQEQKLEYLLKRYEKGNFNRTPRAARSKTAG